MVGRAHTGGHRRGATGADDRAGRRPDDHRRGAPVTDPTSTTDTTATDTAPATDPTTTTPADTSTDPGTATDTTGATDPTTTTDGSGDPTAGGSSTDPTGTGDPPAPTRTAGDLDPPVDSNPPVDGNPPPGSVPPPNDTERRRPAARTPTRRPADQGLGQADHLQPPCEALGGEGVRLVA